MHKSENKIFEKLWVSDWADKVWKGFKVPILPECKESENVPGKVLEALDNYFFSRPFESKMVL